jgi:hypothetical protein
VFFFPICRHYKEDLLSLHTTNSLCSELHVPGLTCNMQLYSSRGLHLYQHSRFFALALVNNGQYGERQIGAILIVVHWVSGRCMPADDHRGKQSFR